MNEKVIYTQKAPDKSNAWLTLVGYVAFVVLIIVLLLVVNFLSYKGILTLAVYALGAYGTYKILNKTTFDITYTLYEDRLVFMRKYGKMTWEGEVFPFNEAKFYPDRIEHRKKIYKFYPDETLRTHLGI